MKIKINRNSFQKVFQIASVVAPARSPKTILQNIKLEVGQEGTVLTATDTELGVRLNVPDVEIEVAGAAVIPVSRLSMILRESTDEILAIEADSERILVTGLNSRFELAAHDPEEFPEVAEFDETDYYEVSGRVLKEMIKRTLFATDAESSRYALGGILLEIENDKIIAVGTDGRRLATMQGSIHRIGEPTTAVNATIVPARAMNLIERLIPDGDDTQVQLAPRSNDLLLRVDEGVFYTRLVEGRFPKWRDVLPSRQETHRIDIPVGPMYSALRQAAIVANEESRGIDFTFKDGSLVLTNTTAEVGQSRIEMPVSFDNEELTITLDHRYVADFLKVLQPDKTFTFDVENGEEAAYCRTDDDYGYVIMPLSKERR